MPRFDRRRAALAGLLFLAGCSSASPPRSVTSTSSLVAGSVTPCRTGPDGGPLQADRGIGGTGAPTIRLADRGIGGTGIIGVITGFASVCVGGHEVTYDPAVPVAIDSRAAAAADLRAGQLAAIEASGPGTDLRARRVMIRHEVVGPVEAVVAPDQLQVAGQRIAVTASTLGDTALRPGEWVAVSGFRGPDGVVHATRLDRQPAGDVELRGLLQREGRVWHVGTLEIQFRPGLRPVPNSLVLLEGHEAGGILYADSLEPDVWQPGSSGLPPLFSGGVEVVVIETFTGYSDGRLVIGRSQRNRGDVELHRSVLELERRPDGSLQPSRFRNLGPGSPSPGAAVSPTVGPGAARPRLEPAPVPARGLEPDRGGLGTRPGQSNRAVTRPGLRGVDGSAPGGADPQAIPGPAAPCGFPGAGPGGFPGRGR